MEFKSLFDYTAAELPPNPQFFRPDWIDLCGEWGFAHDDDDIGVDEGWASREDIFTRTIRVPFPPESRASGIHDPTPHPIIWYRRTFQARRSGKQRVIPNFGAVDYTVAVWVNGRAFSTTVSSAQEYVERLRDLMEAVLDCPGISGFCYKQLTDTEQETNGLLDGQRNPKFAIAVIRDIIAGKENA